MNNDPLAPNGIPDWIWELHGTFINLCVEDKITEDEHGAFENVLDLVLGRVMGAE